MTITISNTFLSSTYIFTVTVDANTVVYTVPTLPTVYYMIGDPAMTVSIPSWIVTLPSCANPPVSYTTTSTPTGVTYTQSTWSAIVYQPAGSTATSQSLTVHATVSVTWSTYKTPFGTISNSNLSYAQTHSYPFILVDPTVSYITPPAVIPWLTYTVTDPVMTVTLPTFTNTDTTLSVDYLLTRGSGLAIDPAVMNMDYTTMVLSIQSNDQSLVGTTVLMTLSAHYSVFPSHVIS